MFALTTLKQHGAGVAWEVAHMREDDPSEKEVAPKRSKTSGASGGGAAANKRRRSSATADDAAAQKRSRSSSSSSRRKAATVAEDVGGSAQQQQEGDSSETVVQDAVYLSLDNEQPQQIAAKLGVELAMLLELNKPIYKGLTARAKLQPGTQIALPPRGAGWYEALKDETPKLIATKLKVDGGVDAIVNLNKPMYKRLSPGSKLQAGTKLLMPGDGCSWHYEVKAADGTVASIAEKLKVEDTENCARNALGASTTLVLQSPSQLALLRETFARSALIAEIVFLLCCSRRDQCRHFWPRTSGRERAT